MIDEFASDRVKKLLVGNKSDLKTERVIAKEKAQVYLIEKKSHPK